MSQKTIAVAGRNIGGNNPCFIIAEIGINHNGSMEIAKKLIDSAVKAGCDAVKFQAFKAKTLYPKTAGKLDWQDGKKKYSYDIYSNVESFEMPYEWVPELQEYCTKKGIIFFSSVCDEKSADYFSKFNVPLFKTTSYAITHLPLLEHIAKKKIPIIISTGGATMEEIRLAYDTVKKYHDKIIILHCIIKYPAPLSTINMNVLDTLRKEFPRAVIGYSDHSAEPADAPVAAICKGAKVIEKHITLDKKMKGPDHFFALEPDELKEMVSAVRKAEKKLKDGLSLDVNKMVLGSSEKKVDDSEKYLRSFAYQCIFAKKDIKKGTILTREALSVLRPGKKERGLEPKELSRITDGNYAASKDISPEDPITWKSIAKKRGVNKVKVLLIVQARMASTRLPGKTLMKLDGKSLIEHTLREASKARSVGKVILATSSSKDNDPLSVLCKKIGFDCFRGSEDDVLKRFTDTAQKYNPELIIRICGDEPLLDAAIIDELVEKHMASGADYSTTKGAVPMGLDAEAFSYDVLRRVDAEAKEPIFREHVTNYILKNPGRFKIFRPDFGKEIARPDIVLTVDTKYDFDFVESIYFALRKRKASKEKRRAVAGGIASGIIKLVDSCRVMRKPAILLRADGSDIKGMGDIISLMNIAGHLSEKFEPIFASKDYPGTIDFIKKRQFEVLSLPLTMSDDEEIKRIRAFCDERKIGLGIVELVPNNPGYVKRLSGFLKVMMVDFLGGIRISTDVLLNWDVGADGKKYSCGNGTMKLLGPRHTPLRGDILACAKRTYSSSIRTITISFGSSDPNGLTLKALEALIQTRRKYTINVIIGPFMDKNYYEKKIISLASKIGSRIKIIPSPTNTHELFSKSDLVICGGGLTSFELCALGVPFIGTSMIGWEIERLKRLDRMGACRYVSANGDLPSKIFCAAEGLSGKVERKRIAASARKIVDGKGSQRIAKALISRWS